jgi:hypothetical protein
MSGGPRRKDSWLEHGIARSVQDRTTVDRTQTRLVLRNEFDQAFERALDQILREPTIDRTEIGLILTNEFDQALECALNQIQAVLRDTYPESPPQDE